MVNFTSNTYQMKREILSFSNKISKNLPKPEKKFMADMNFREDTDRMIAIGGGRERNRKRQSRYARIGRN